MDLRERLIHGNEGLPVAAYDVTPEHSRYEMKPHWHPEHEILHIRKGRFTLRLDGEVYNLKAGDVVFYPGGSIHTGTPENCEYTCILLNLSLMMKKHDICMDFAKKLDSGEIIINPVLPRNVPEFSEICDRALKDFSERYDGYAFLVKADILEFFGRILNLHLYKKTDEKNGERVDGGLIKSVIKYMESNYSSNVSLQTLADLAHITPTHLCRCFKAVTGKTPIAYLLDYRLSKARHALLGSDRPITDIALESGFNDISYFTRRFRERYGITPKQFKIQQKKDFE